MAGEVDCGQEPRCEGVRDGEIERYQDIFYSSVTNSWERYGIGCFHFFPTGGKNTFSVTYVGVVQHGPRSRMASPPKSTKHVESLCRCSCGPKSPISSHKSEMAMSAISG